MITVGWLKQNILQILDISKCLKSSHFNHIIFANKVLMVLLYITSLFNGLQAQRCSFRLHKGWEIMTALSWNFPASPGRILCFLLSYWEKLIHDPTVSMQTQEEKNIQIADHPNLIPNFLYRNGLEHAVGRSGSHTLPRQTRHGNSITIISCSSK